MGEDLWVRHWPLEGDGSPEIEYLRDACFGKTVFYRYMRRGALGCSLSHLSILKDALDSGYETIWVLEDDISVRKDPHILSELIRRLDALVGEDGWDILYTDNDPPRPTDSDLKEDLWIWRRPDSPSSDLSPYGKRTKISEDFSKIGTRERTHSMVIRRSGMKKIFEFEKTNHIFLPIDEELTVVPTIQLYMLRYPVITYGKDNSSDIRNKL